MWSSTVVPPPGWWNCGLRLMVISLPTSVRMDSSLHHPPDRRPMHCLREDPCFIHPSPGGFWYPSPLTHSPTAPLFWPILQRSPLNSSAGVMPVPTSICSHSHRCCMVIESSCAVQNTVSAFCIPGAGITLIPCAENSAGTKEDPEDGAETDRTA